MASGSHPHSSIELATSLGLPQEIPVGDAIDLSEDLYAQIVRQVQSICQSVAVNSSVETESPQQRMIAQPLLAEDSNSEFPTKARVPAVEPHQVEVTQKPCPPMAPQTLADSGLSLNQLSDLILKLVYLNGSLTGFEVAKQLRLPFRVVDESLAFLKNDRSLEVSSGEFAGRLSYRFALTDQGRKRSREAFDECRYVGPAPVSLASYVQQSLSQSTRNVALTPATIRAAFRDLVLEESLLSRLGPAILSGHSIFLFGTPGNGKTLIAKAIGSLMDRCGGEIYVPYAVSVDRNIMTVFDPSLHRPLSGETMRHQPESAESTNHEDNFGDQDIDQRWRKIKRPVVMTGGELSLEMLDLKFHSASGYYTAPLHMKSNGGVFLLDDFGRQLVPPAELLNRWILPLEERIDYLTLTTGKKFAIPFEQLIIFSTNLAPTDLADQAFLRRIRHKIPISAPSEAQFREIFKKCCQQRGIRYDDWIVSQLLNNYYKGQRPPKSSDPRDLLDIAQAICRFKEQEFHLSEEVLAEAWRECHGDLQVHQAGVED